MNMMMMMMMGPCHHGMARPKMASDEKNKNWQTGRQESVLQREEKTSM
jgi:hypothetical protein